MDKLDCKSFRKHLDQMLVENGINTVVVLSHVNADGDAAGSAMSLAHYLNVIYPHVCDETDIELAVSNDMARFVVIKIVDGLPERLLELGNVRLKDIDIESEPIIDAFRAGLISTVLYDRAFGEDSQKNICRTQNQAYLLSDKLKKAANLYQECLNAKNKKE